MLQEMACPTACPENRLVRRLVQLVVIINYFGVDRPVMTLVCVLVLKRTPTLRTSDHRPLSVPNIVIFVATTPSCNPIFVVWIANEVADINSCMLSNCISADNNIPFADLVALPSVNLSVKHLSLGRLSSARSYRSFLPQSMGIVDKAPNVLAIPERYLVEILCLETVFPDLFVICVFR